MAYITVLNVNGSSKNKKDGEVRKPPKGYTTWLDFWLDKHPTETELPKKCMACEVNDVNDGAHVRIDGETNKEYIIPFCHKCNMAEDGTTFIVDDNALVPVVS